ncbi:MAG: fibronectin type III domain-containing protein [Kofleriaceae bacterium]|nr:fibronectin type III domain-containing protein [Kofleriaceae bacterium]
MRRPVLLTLCALCASPAATLAEGETCELVNDQCSVVTVAMKPEARTDRTPGTNLPPQIVVWVEKPDGTYVDTIFITKETGTYGLGNRPGRADFNSGPLWPYGRRTMVFPIWAHRHGQEYDEVRFQNYKTDGENNLSHPFNQSSRDPHFCRPMQSTEVEWDALTCASPNGVFTDKGVLTNEAKSKYPPRQDVLRAPGMDSVSVDLYPDMNRFDAVSQATPPVGQLANVTWPIPAGFQPGDYVMWVEVSKEFDHNDTYSTTAYPAPTNIPWGDYGEPFRGQPSVVFKVPFRVDTSSSRAQVSTYAGYGDPDGLDGELRAPDGTITTGVQGSGEGRLGLVTDTTDGTMFRVQVTAQREADMACPGAISTLAVDASTGREAHVTFKAPGDDGMTGKVSTYEVRYRVGSDVTKENFDQPDSFDPKPAMDILEPGLEQTFTLDRLLPDTEYSLGIRAVDNCHNKSGLQVIRFKTPERAVGEVDACFVATAAYGSVMAADVQMLRHLRDSVLRKTVLGELAVQTYYTFSPPVAGLIGESELLRSTARSLLLPIVTWVRAFSF